MSQTWPFVGRDDELRFVIDALSTGGGRGVVLVGPPGVGKTRLAQEAVRVARADGFAAISIGATPATSEIPLGAMAPWLPEEAIAQPDRTRMLAQGCAALAERADRAPLLLYVDDAHLLDPLSAALIHQAVMSETASLLATKRRGSRGPSELSALWTNGNIERLEVTGLSRDDHDRLVESTLDGTVHGPTLERLWRITDGNVLFLRVVIDAALASGDLGEHAGVWRLDAPIQPGPALVDLVDSHIGALTADEERIIEYVAFAEPVDAELIVAVASTADLERAERTGTVVALREDGRVRLRLAHPLYGEVVRAHTPLLRARTVVRELADALESRRPTLAGDVLALASWRLATGDRCDLDVLLAASRCANDRFDYELAERLASAAAITHGGPVASLAHAKCLFLAGRFAEAESVFQAVTLDALDDGPRADAVVARATNLMWGLGDFGAADRLLTTTARSIVDASIVNLVHALQARFALAAGAVNQALDLTAAVRADPHTDLITRITADVARAPALAIGGHTTAALALAESLPFPPDRLAEHPVEADTLAVTMISALWFAGDLEHAAVAATDLYERGVRLSYWEAICDGARSRAAIELACGRPRSAIRWAREALASIPDDDRTDLTCWCRAVLAEALAVAGDAGAPAVASSMHADRHRSVRIFDAQVARADAWVAAASGEFTRAVQILEAGAEAARAGGAFAPECLLLHDVVRLDRPERAADRLHELADVVDGRSSRTFADHAAALLARDPGMIERVATVFSGMGAALLAAEAEMQAAHVHRRRGAERERRRASSRALTIAANCEGARTPALSAPESVEPLTRREREIAALAGQGLASPEIARRLTVSTRTVEGHLHRMYAKLGVSRREDLGRHLPA